ncbi:universal stress protein [Candidatus Magnetomonas plexicatena]|uniref:universal stress protein n=1 Tax=Candidatus Magnetomonas plexicatena TaxID=2552947 RepID=UPI001C78DC96|nr:universal stress protein [Nitrospirales bacterium LBB_01]
MEIRKILLPTDFMEGASGAADYTADLAKHYGASIDILHVVYDVASAVGWYMPQLSYDEFYKDIEKNALKELEHVYEKQLKDVRSVNRFIARGNPADEILNYASTNRIDLIVMGTHGRKGIDRLIFGGTAEKVVRNAKCPVLTTRINEHSTVMVHNELAPTTNTG